MNHGFYLWSRAGPKVVRGVNHTAHLSAIEAENNDFFPSMGDRIERRSKPQSHARGVLRRDGR